MNQPSSVEGRNQQGQVEGYRYIKVEEMVKQQLLPPGKKLRVLARLVEWFPSLSLGLFEEGGIHLIGDITLCVPIKLSPGSLYQLLGETTLTDQFHSLKRNSLLPATLFPTPIWEGIISIRLVRPVDGLNVELYYQAMALKNNLLGES